LDDVSIVNLDFGVEFKKSIE